MRWDECIDILQAGLYQVKNQQEIFASKPKYLLEPQHIECQHFQDSLKKAISKHEDISSLHCPLHKTFIN